MTVRYAASGGLARITLERPPLNILDIPTSRTLEAAFRRAGRDRSVRVVVLGARGKCFSAGVDIRDHAPARVGRMLRSFHGAVRALLALEKPVIASIHGHCLGGGFELALASDFIVAEAGSAFALPEISLACYPPVAAVLLPGMIGRQRANALILTGGKLSLSEARSLGLVSALSEKALLKRLLSLSASALACAKAAMRSGSLAGAERIYLGHLARTADMAEGVRAFVEKRRPVWRMEVPC